jgi:hypothetical protein
MRRRRRRTRETSQSSPSSSKPPKDLEFKWARSEKKKKGKEGFGLSKSARALSSYLIERVGGLSQTSLRDPSRRCRSRGPARSATTRSLSEGMNNIIRRREETRAEGSRIFPPAGSVSWWVRGRSTKSSNIAQTQSATSDDGDGHEGAKEPPWGKA